ncbi:MAG TPA: thiamine pyrophosphate-binding protein [Verrucomicrobiae bacterium]|nr:thiamine pyrophosphate-binding protein [Verrucomicrobiae bacterium]
MMKLSAFVAARLADWGLTDLFMIPGGGAMHLNDSFGRESRIRYWCNHHEQASAIAAECYARVTGKTGVINVTTGPGGINALNGVFGAWTDSVPMLVISGQVKRETCMATTGMRHLRQLGDQEADIIRMAGGITKYAVLVDDPQSIRYHLERAWFLAADGRPGPCWLDIPVDVQAALIDPGSLRGYDPAEDAIQWDHNLVARQCGDVIARLASADRPVILAGSGVRAANALEEFREMAALLRIPVTTAWTHDLIASDDELFCGRPGTIGERAGNFTVQNADALLVLGSRLNIRQVSYNWRSFARNAYTMQVDVDAAELGKPTVRPDMAIHCDLKVFLQEMLRQVPEAGYRSSRHCEWLNWCRERVRRYPVVQEKHRASVSPVNPYYFIEQLFASLGEDDVVVCGNAAACIVPYQVAKLKAGQRLISNSGSASMGYDLPAAVGAAVGRTGGRVICIAGDGSIQLNVQELQTIFHHRLPIKIFVLANGGYLSIRQTQSNFFGNLVGESEASGTSFPDMTKLAGAYGLPAMRLDSALQLSSIRTWLDIPGPALCQVMLDPGQEFEPRLKSRQLPDGQLVSPNLEDMYPFLPAEELEQNLLTGEAAAR